MGYCTRDDVYLLALAAPAFLTRARPFDAVSIASASIRLNAHGLSNDDLITFEVSSGGSLPTGISDATVYHPIITSSDVFRVATTTNGTLIASWASGGSGWGINVDVGRRLDRNIEERSAFADEHLTAHELPLLTPYPQVLIGLVARMAARQTIVTLEFENTSYRTAVDRLMASEEQDLKLLADWKAGKPIQPRPTDSDTIADDAPIASSLTAIDWITTTL